MGFFLKRGLLEDAAKDAHQEAPFSKKTPIPFLADPKFYCTCFNDENQ